ncbi:alpha/beta fold hydrolase [Mangrovicoccus ximenensis]|uniref:alpha/beta fold hydrolase n=1 Tax=Mangrovicoccus ximenensis TaxID=1911570 RepID=UPI000D3855C1|nr:alpha/beta fold hydrolase [Mangrovicoccus ximenensis]
MSDTFTRMAPGEAAAEEALQGWAMTRTDPVAGPERPFDLLFVHGMASGGWIWSRDWLDRFAAAGYRSWTITLPGRSTGGSIATNPAVLDTVLSLAFETGDSRAALELLAQSFPGMPALDGPTLDDFSDAISTCLDQIGRPAAVVAHSLGGAATQNLMRRGRRPEATVLLASVPPYGLWRASMEMAWFNPELYLALMDFSMAGLNAGNVGVMRHNLFPSGISDREFDALVPQMTDESLRAMTQALGFPPFAPLPGPQADVLVIGGALDRMVPMADVYGTALYYGGLPRIIPGAGHVLMMGEPVAPATSEIIAFLETRQG